ncbi:hypothetical protein ACETIH_03120 [Microvirga arabica]|uniref:Uncharacterized protein n=1 Tax=Microvirga arabica TaxID=1128671 RepID=A0ABV6Y3X0_9HYPH
MDVADDPLLKRAEAVVAETVRLRESHTQFRIQVWCQLAEMQRIERELDPLLPHPPEELAVVRGILAHEKERLDFA